MSATTQQQLKYGKAVILVVTLGIIGAILAAVANGRWTVEAVAAGVVLTVTVKFILWFFGASIKRPFSRRAD